MKLSNTICTYFIEDHYHSDFFSLKKNHKNLVWCVVSESGHCGVEPNLVNRYALSLTSSERVGYLFRLLEIIE